MGSSSSAPKLVQELASDSVAVREAAVKGICRIAAVPEKRRYAAIAGCVPPLIALVVAGDPRIVEPAVTALSHLAMHPENKVEIAGAGGVAAIVELLENLQKDPTAIPGTKGAAAAALANLSSRCAANQTKAAELGAIPILAELLRDNAPQARIWAAVAFGNIAIQHEQNQERICKAGAISPLVNIAHSAADAATAAAAEPRGSGESVFSCRHRAITGPGRVRRGDLKLQPEQQRWILKALSSVAFNHDGNQEQIVEAGGLVALAGLMQNGEAATKFEALKTLCNVLGSNADRRKQLAKAPNGITSLVALVRKGTSHDERSLAAMLLAGLGGSGHEADVVQAGGAAALTDLAAVGGPPAALSRERAAVALFHLASSENEDVKKRLIEANAARPLVRLALGEGASPRAAVFAARALGCLAEGSEENRKHVEQVGGASVLRQLDAMMDLTVNANLQEKHPNALDESSPKETEADQSNGAFPPSPDGDPPKETEIERVDSISSPLIDLEDKEDAERANSTFSPPPEGSQSNEADMDQGDNTSSLPPEGSRLKEADVDLVGSIS